MGRVVKMEQSLNLGGTSNELQWTMQAGPLGLPNTRGLPCGARQRHECLWRHFHLHHGGGGWRPGSVVLHQGVVNVAAY
jgi:hypothetical protein